MQKTAILFRYYFPSRPGIYGSEKAFGGPSADRKIRFVADR
jgi:hypothetical protein